MKAAVRDFPDWLGPMLVKELRQGLRSRGFVFSFVGLQILLVLTVTISALIYAKDPRDFQPHFFTGMFWAMVGSVLLIVTPLRAFNELSGERKANTLELIHMTHLTPWRIAVGKWSSLMFQAALFTVSVFPYAILRYFFGGVNLAEDMVLLAFVVMTSAALSAGMIAISGMPTAVRGIAIFFVVLGLFSVLPGLVFGLFFTVFGGGIHGGGSTYWSVRFSGATGSGMGWLAASLFYYNLALVILASLEVAAASIAPPAENHALRQRLLVLAAWLPIPILMSMKGGSDFAIVQNTLFLAAAAISLWHDLAQEPRPLRNQIAPFASRRRVGAWVGRLFYPGWPSAYAFFLLIALLEIAPVATYAVISNFRQVNPWADIDMLIFLLMAAAAILTPRLLLFRRKRARMPLLEQTLVHLMSGALVVLIHLAWQIKGGQVGNQFWLGALPPAGLWAAVAADDRMNSEWFAVSASAFIVTTFLIGMASLPHWRALSEVEREFAAKGPVEPTAAATTPA